jgi:hypothetical protein
MIIRRTLPGGFQRPFYLSEIPIGLPRHCRVLCVEVLITLQSCHLWPHIITYPSKTFIPHHSESTIVVGASNSTWPHPCGIGGGVEKAWNLNMEAERRGEERSVQGFIHLTHEDEWNEGPVTVAFYNLSLIKKAETVQVHFTLGGEGPKGPKKLSWVKKCTWIPTWQIVNNVSCFMVFLNLH